MNKYIYKSFAAFMALGLTMSSCSDFLDAENKSAGGNDADSYFSKTPSALLNTAYAELKDLATVIDMNEHGTDMFLNTRGHAAGVFNDYTLTPEDATVKSYYSNAYKMINYANGVMSYAGEKSSETYEARFLRAYGYYLLTQQFGSVPYITTYINSSKRDYPRTDLAEVYSSTIADLEDLYKNSSLAANSHEGRASKQAVAALLAKMYLAAGWDVQTTLDDAAQGTYTVNDKTNFEQAAQWAEKAINGIALTMPFADKWSPSNEGNAEEIWSVQYDRDSYPGDKATGGHSLQNSYGGYFGNITDFGIKYTGSDNQPTAKMMRLFDKGDTRYEGTFMTTYYNSVKNGSAAAEWGENGYYAYYNLDATKLATHPIAFKFYPYYVTQAEVEADLTARKAQFAEYDNRSVLVPKAVRLDDANNVLIYSFDKNGKFTMTKSNYETYIQDLNSFGSVKKYDDPKSDQVTKDNDYRDIVIFHVSDMYLVAAEAYYMAGQTGKSLEKLNAVRSRAGIPALSSFSAYTPEYTTTSTFTVKDIDVILDERARELYGEQQRWVDLRRTKQLVRYNVEFNSYISNASDMANAKGEYKWLRPIPSNEISSNEGISTENQNPGY